MEEAIRSVLLQKYPKLELFVVDGGSTDDSVSIIKKYDKWIDWWISEPDGGQSQALNKGLTRATGDLFNWVNSDDLLAENALWNVANSYLADSQVDIICGFFTLFSKEKSKANRRMRLFQSLEKTLVFGHVSPCCMFYKLSTFRKTGSFNESLHYCFDLEKWFKYLDATDNIQFKTINFNLAFFRWHDQSKTIASPEKFIYDKINIHHSILYSYNPTDSFLTELNNISGIYYQSQWNLKNLNPKIYKAYLIQFILEKCFHSFNFFKFFKYYFHSFFLAPFKRDWRFYILPIRLLYRKISN